VIEDVIVAADVSIRRAGLSTVSKDGEEICASAAAVASSPLSRAWFELLERVAAHEARKDSAERYPVLDIDGVLVGKPRLRAEIFPESDDPERWRYARSNGIAIHRDWRTACERAFWELAERDRIVRAWYGEIRPTHLPLEVSATVLAGASGYDWRVCSFPEPDPDSFSRSVEVVGVFGLPREDNGSPFVLGLAGRGTVGEAIDAATAEVLQLLGFLWGEPSPTSISSQPGPMQHLDTYQIPGAHEAIREWLDGGHAAYATEHDREPAPVQFVDLTADWLPDNMRVAKAVCAQAVPLVFGDTPLAGHLPAHLRRHPIP
jgi:hypothetical protein